MDVINPFDERSTPTTHGYISKEGHHDPKKPEKMTLLHMQVP
jgi:hypothetical protein